MPESLLSKQKRHSVPDVRVTGEYERKGFTSLWDQAQTYLAIHGERLNAQRKDVALGKNYGESVVRSKVRLCAEHFNDCADAYLKRRKTTKRELDSKKTRERLQQLVQGRLYEAKSQVVKKLAKQIKQQEMRRELNLLNDDASPAIEELRQQLIKERADLEILPIGQPARDAADHVLLEEATQEYALRLLDQKVYDGHIDPEALNAQMWKELDLAVMPERLIRSTSEAVAAMHEEVAVFEQKGYINAQEARTIIAYGDRYAREFIEGYQKYLKKDQLPRELYQVLRDNARKVAYQTTIDKRTLAGSDHGVRHIYEGNTHFAEQLMTSLEGMKDIDLKQRDKVLIRQIIIDHDMGYTTAAAQSKDGGDAAKDHPCIGCRYVESNRSYYEQKFGKHGYDVIRDVLLNHSYPSSKYLKKRPDGTMTYNRHLIRSVVSTVDSLSTTSETKAMELFRFPETIHVLQNVRLYADAHDGVIDDQAMTEFKQDLQTCVDKLVDQKKVSPERAAAYREAIDRSFTARTVKKTFGQYSGVIHNIRLVKSSDGKEWVPEVRMNLSRLQALVAEAFGDTVSLAGFKKAMEAFGLSADELKRLGKIVGKLRREKNPFKRNEMLQELRFVTDRAQFLIGEQETTGLPDEREQEHQTLIESFEHFHQEAARDNINALFDRIRGLKKPRDASQVQDVFENLQTILETDRQAEIEQIRHIADGIQRYLPDNDALEILQSEAKRLLSKRERRRISRETT